jgi:hypothetical protein
MVGDMSRLKSKNILHLIVLFALFLLIVVLLTIPSNVVGAPPYRIDFQGSYKTPSTSENARRFDSRESDAQRRLDQAKRAQQRAYIPRGEWQNSSEQFNRSRADSDVRNAERELQQIQSDRYMEKRIIESHKRDAKILAEKERQLKEQLDKKRYEPPPRAKK